MSAMKDKNADKGINAAANRSAQSFGTINEANNNRDKRWNMFVYFAGDNNLIEESIWALTELDAIADKLDNISLKAYFDHGLFESYYEFKPSTAQPVGVVQGQVGNVGKRGGRLPVGTLKSSEGQTKESLQKFILQASQDAGAATSIFTNANSYNVVILSGHSNSDPLTLLPTNNPQKALSLPQLRLALAGIKQDSGRELDILGIDSCNMGSVETIYELADHVHYLVAAQGYEQGTGWPYREILSAVNSLDDPAKAARFIVCEYTNYYADYVIAGVSTDLVAYDLRYKPQLDEAMQVLTVTLLQRCQAEDVRKAILLAHWHAQSFKSELEVDLLDFCQLLRQESTDPLIQAACEAVEAAVQRIVLFHSYTGAATQYSNGVSIYFPWSMRDWRWDQSAYRPLRFAHETHWDEFLDRFIELTQRGPRKCEEAAGKFNPVAEWNMPLETDLAFEIKTNPANDTRTNPANDTRTNPANDTRTNPANDTRTNPANDTRTNPANDTRTNPANDTRNKKIRSSQVKNPPERFYRYEEECKIE